MKGKYDKISNYNLSYENFLEAINEFEGFVMGVSNNDIFLFTDSKDIKEIRSQIETANREDKDTQNINHFTKHVASRLLDRTTGTYFFKDMFNGNVQDTYLKMVAGFKDTNVEQITVALQLGLKQLTGGANEGLGRYLHIIPPTADQFALDANRNNAFEDCIPKILTEEETTQLNMSNTIRFYNASKVRTKFLTNSTTGELEQVEDENGILTPKEYYSSAEFEDKEPKLPEINTKSDPDRFDRPTLCAMVFRHPTASYMSRNKSHLPIFFNAITPLEMSRCVPYIDIRIVTMKYGEKARKVGDLSQVKFMRFLRNSKTSNFELDDSIGFGAYTPVNEATAGAENKLNDMKIDYSYMDVFTTPATFNNAKINREQGKIFRKNGNVNDPVLNPIMPFLTLKDLTVSITGAGFGLMASKRASLSLTLHDRSRMVDIAPLISTTQFATTKVIIEYGWNHPEGGVNSDNVIGKYLNALKERSVFQVVGTDYRFGEGGTVDIDVDLAAYGFKQTERVHAGAGPEVPLNTLSNYIEKATADILKSKRNEFGDEPPAEAPQILQEIKTNSRAARSINAMISWEAYSKIAENLKNNNKDDELLRIIKTVLLTSPTDLNDQKIDDKIEAANNDTEDLSFLNGEPPDQNPQDLSGVINSQEEINNSVARIFGKLEDIRSANQTDAFMFSTVTDGVISSEINKNATKEVTLGKLISHFVGHPLAASCLYDEVQLVFYPLNHHAAGARIHTTASMPLPVDVVYEKIVERLKQNSHLSVKSMFSLLEKIVRDKNIPVYGLADMYVTESDLKSRDPEKVTPLIRAAMQQNELEGLGLEEDSEQDKELLDLLNDNTLTNEAFEEKVTKKSEIAAIDSQIKENAQILQSLKSQGFEPTVFQDENLTTGPAPTNTGPFTVTDTSGASKQYTTAQANALTIDQAKLQQDRADLSKLKARYQSIKSALTKRAVNQRVKSVTRMCERIYKTDGVTDIFPAEGKFVRPNIALDYEVIDVIAPPTTDNGRRRFFQNKPQNGLLKNKQILRVHIYDEESVMDPSKYAVLQALIEGASHKVISGKNFQKITEYIAKQSFNDVKQIIKRSYPTIIYGANNSTVKNMSVSANTSGEIANVLMVESYGNLKNGQVKAFNYENEFESVVTFPNTVNIQLMGMPMIGRGNNIFIDFGTNTSVDNIYTVKTVTHSLSEGNFSTSLEVVPSNMGAIASFKDKLSNTIEKIRKNE